MTEVDGSVKLSFFGESVESATWLEMNRLQMLPSTFNLNTNTAIIMPLNFLDMPLEIRLHIYTYLLVSPTGFVKIGGGPYNPARRQDVKYDGVRPWELIHFNPRCECTRCTPSVSIDRSICQVSKNISEACHDILWGQHTFAYDNELDLVTLGRQH